MKAIIEGKRYDTDNAELIGYHSNGSNKIPELQKLESEITKRGIMKYLQLTIIAAILLTGCSTEPELDEPTSQVIQDINKFVTKFGGSGEDHLKSVLQTSDGGYILAGNTSSHDGDFEGVGSEFRYSEFVAFLMKINSGLEMEWVRTYGGSGGDTFEHIFITEEGFTVIGSSSSDDGDFSSISNQTFRTDIDPEGHITSIHSVDDNLHSYFTPGGARAGYYYYTPQVQKLENGNVVSAAESHFGGTEFLAIFNDKLKPHYTFGLGSGNDLPMAMVQDSDGGFVVTGNTTSKDGVFEGMHDDLLSGANVFIGKFDLSGELVWLNSYGGRENDEVHTLVQTRNGNYLIAGTNETNDGDFEGMGGEFQRGINQIFLIKIDSNGNTIWKKTFGGGFDDDSNRVLSILEASDEQLVMVGMTTDSEFMGVGSDRTGFYAPEQCFYPCFIFVANLSLEGDFLQAEIYRSGNISYHSSLQPAVFSGNNRLIMMGSTINSLDIYFLDIDLD